MARLPRYFVDGQAQYVIRRGNNREPIFAHDQDYHFYLECLEEAAERHALDIHAYVLMTNHVHLPHLPAGHRANASTLQPGGRPAGSIGRRVLPTPL
jgi:putative transposase